MPAGPVQAAVAGLHHGHAWRHGVEGAPHAFVIAIRDLTVVKLPDGRKLACAIEFGRFPLVVIDDMIRNGVLLRQRPGLIPVREIESGIACKDAFIGRVDGCPKKVHKGLGIPGIDRRIVETVQKRGRKKLGTQASIDFVRGMAGKSVISPTKKLVLVIAGLTAGIGEVKQPVFTVLNRKYNLLIFFVFLVIDIGKIRQQVIRARSDDGFCQFGGCTLVASV